jgi:UDP-N-acetylmuramoylalanine--D-glutamate ligase
VGEDALHRAVTSFRPVPHRLEPVGAIGGVALWNDSKATNVQATLAALTAFPDGGVRLILGGSDDKDADFAPLVAALPGAVRATYLVGPAGRRLRPLLDAAGVPAVEAGTLEPALDAALAAARPGEVVLLAPANASFDEFADYAARGERFRALARARGAR